MNQSQLAKSLRIPVKIFIEMESCMLTACQVSHFIGKIEMIKYILETGLSRDDIYRRCESDDDEMKGMFQECVFLNEMMNRGYTDTKKDDDMVWRYIEYWREI